MEEEERGRSVGEVGWKAFEPPNVTRAATMRVVVVDEEGPHCCSAAGDSTMLIKDFMDSVFALKEHLWHWHVL